jgi:tetratricopeptide (TPR) repeat protein
MISVGEMAETLNKEADDFFKQNPESAEANNKRGISLRMRNQGDDLQESIVYFSKAIELSPGNAEYFHNRSISYSMIGSVDAAITDLDKAIELEPGNPEFYFYRALEYFEKKDYDKCWVDIQKADSAGFRDRFKSEEGMFIRFIIDLDKASGRNPYSSKEQDDLNKSAYAYMQKGMFAEAANELSRVIESNPAALFAYFYRAVAYENIGKFEEALSDYNKVIDSYPDHKEALAGRQACLAELRK